jgi:diguanylate cyclase (GGDEF)-like protein/PAS domain S-box-containing protein
VRNNSESTNNRHYFSLLRQKNLFLRLIGCFATVLLAAVFVLFFDDLSHNGTTSMIWVANGVLLAYLLLAPRWQWPGYLAAGFAALSVGAIFIHKGFQMHSLVLIAFNLAEVLLAAWLLRPRAAALPRFTDADYLLRFFGYAVFAAPLVTGIAKAVLLANWSHSALLPSISHWAVYDGLGIAVATPTFVAIFRGRFKNFSSYKQPAILAILLIVVSITACIQSTVPLLFLIYPLLVVILLRLGLGAAAMGTLFFALCGGFFTSRAVGPFLDLAHNFPMDSSMMLQRFVIGAIIILYSVSIVLEKQKSTERKLQEIVTLHKLVTENNRDVIILADMDGHRRYVSASTVSMGGWTPDELMAQGSFDLIHEYDVEIAQNAIDGLHNGDDEACIQLRVRKKDEEYLWVESCLRLIRDEKTGLPTGILNIVRDITERKRADQQLQEAYNAVEALAITDGLTGLANRRRFDQYLTTEWRRSMREHTPLSLLMLDADFFKSYNDTYGHTRGDSCLRQIAEAAQDIVSRPGDLVARFGGEEFTVILPNTDNIGAMKVAEEICIALSSRKLPHSGNPYGICTISIGCATMVPKFGHHAVNLIEMADKALYDAKHSGRNRVCNGNEEAGEPEQAVTTQSAS